MNVIDPCTRRLFSEKVPPELHLLEGNVTAELNVRQVSLVVLIPSVVVHLGVVVGITSRGAAIRLDYCGKDVTCF